MDLLGVVDDLKRSLVGIGLVPVLCPPLFDVLVSVAQLLGTPVVCV